MLNEAAQDRNQNSSHAQPAKVLFHPVPTTIRPQGSIFGVGHEQLMLVEKCNFQSNSMMRR